MSEESDAKRVVDMVMQSAKEKQPCIICGSPTRNRSIFAPNNSQEWGAPKGKSCYFVAALCLAHPPNLETQTTLENKIFAQVHNAN